MRYEYRRAAWRLRQRLIAIRKAAKNPPSSFSLDWQLGSLQNELERAFGFRSGDFDDMAAASSTPPQEP